MVDNPEKILKQMLEKEKTAKIICAELNNFVNLKDVLMTVMDHVKKLTGCMAVSIRLHEDGDYPYFVYDGFPESFIEKENSLCAKDEGGNRIPLPDENGYLLDCMCGNIIQGRFDASLPFFTENGSFWANHTSALLRDTTEEDRQSGTRNHCNSCGYESVALIPIKVAEKRIGLIQLNDLSKNRFTEDLIEYLEMIAGQIGLAVQNSRTYTKLKESLEEIKVLKGIIPICSSCKDIRDEEGSWTQMETYFKTHSDVEFNHGICADCAKKLYPQIDTDVLT